MKDKEKQIINEIKQDFEMHEEKHKQIEEMALTIQSYSDIEQSYYDEGWHSVDVYGGLAKTLYSKDFRIVNKDSVVLSREECEAHKKWLKELAKSNKEFEKIGYEKGSKETAKEFYDKFNENICCFKLENKSEEYKDGYVQAIADICGKLDQTAIELGVDLKEYYGKQRKTN